MLKFADYVADTESEDQADLALGCLNFQRCKEFSMRYQDWILCLTSLLVSILCTGCSIFPKAGNSELPAAAAGESETERFFVEFHQAFGEDRQYTGIVDGTKTVQTAIDEAGIKKQIGGMEVDVIRQLPNGRVLKMPVEIESGKKVKYQQDYALHDGDRVIVQAKSNSPLEKIVGSVLGQ